MLLLVVFALAPVSNILLWLLNGLVIRRAKNKLIILLACFLSAHALSPLLLSLLQISVNYTLRINFCFKLKSIANFPQTLTETERASMPHQSFLKMKMPSSLEEMLWTLQTMSWFTKYSLQAHEKGGKRTPDSLFHVTWIAKTASFVYDLYWLNHGLMDYYVFFSTEEKHTG